MTKKVFTNNGRSTLAAGITALDLAFSVQPGEGARFPAPAAGQSCRITLVDNLGNREIVDCTARVADAFTITRGAEGTAPRAFGINSKVSLRVTKETLEDLRDGVNLGTMAQQNANAVAITGGSIGGVAIQAGNVGAPLPRGHIAGLGISNNGGDLVNDIDFATGVCRSSDDSNNIVLAGALTKQLDAAWALGTNQGMRATGAPPANGTYHLFAILRPDTGVVDIAADTDVTGANIAANTNAAYTKKRRIGSILREAGAIVAFSQWGDEFLRTTTVLDIDSTNPGAAAVDRTLSVPVGLKVRAIMNVQATFGAVGSEVLLTAKDETDQAPSQTVAPLGTTGVGSNLGHIVGRQELRTDTTAKIRSRLDGSDGSATLKIATIGWLDKRGRDD